MKIRGKGIMECHFLSPLYMGHVNTGDFMGGGLVEAVNNTHIHMIGKKIHTEPSRNVLVATKYTSVSYLSYYGSAREYKIKPVDLF